MDKKDNMTSNKTKTKVMVHIRDERTRTSLIVNNSTLDKNNEFTCPESRITKMFRI